MEKEYYIYKHTNTINNKIYIGQTFQEPQKRWQNGLSAYRHNKHFYNAIKKYGWENFTHEILLSGLTKEEMIFFENYYIEYYDSRNPEKGYNINKGGEVSPFSYLWEDESFREKMRKQQSDIMKERLKDPKERERLREISIENWKNHPERKDIYSKRMTDWLNEQWAKPEYRKKMSDLLKDRWQSEEREKLIENTKKNAKKNWANPEYRKKMCKAVVNIETGLVFESAAAASRWCGIDRSGVTKALKSSTKCAGKHPETGVSLHWRYAAEGGEL